MVLHWVPENWGLGQQKGEVVLTKWVQSTLEVIFIIKKSHSVIYPSMEPYAWPGRYWSAPSHSSVRSERLFYDLFSPEDFSLFGVIRVNSVESVSLRSDRHHRLGSLVLEISLLTQIVFRSQSKLSDHIWSTGHVTLTYDCQKSSIKGFRTWWRSRPKCKTVQKEEKGQTIWICQIGTPVKYWSEWGCTFSERSK